MGTSASKAMNPVERLPNEDITSTAPISTPQINKLNMDPRSPSSDIARTPIEVLRIPLGNGKQTALIDDLNNDEEFVHLALDPRSPTTEFHRTPIVIQQSAQPKPTLRNKNLDNARMRDVVGTPAKMSNNLAHVTRRICKSPIPPKLIDSSPIAITTATNKRNSVVGLLETNLDFVETDLDNVLQSKRDRLLEEVEQPDTPNEIEEQQLPHEDTEISSDQVIIEEELPPTQIMERNEVVANVEEKLPSESAKERDDVVSESEDYNSSIQCDENEPKVQVQENETNQVSDKEEEEEVVPEIKTPKKETVNVNTTNKKCDDNLPAKQNALIKVEKTTRAAAAVDELDRKLSNLIYEDKQCMLSPSTRKMLSSQPQKVRTPLSDRNVNHQRKSIPVLKVSDKPTTKGGKVSLSKIPVFKEKPGRRGIQCENTEPKVLPKKSQWSTEDSLLI